MFALDLEELVGFLLVRNLSGKAEMGEHTRGWQVDWFCRSTLCQEGEPWETVWDWVTGSFIKGVTFVSLEFQKYFLSL